MIWWSGFIQGQTRSLGPNQEAEDERQEHERQPGERRHPVLELPAQDHRPRGVEDVVDEDHHQHPDRHRGPEADPDEPRGRDDVWPETSRDADGRHGRAGEADP
jgi:hypothetical protein